MYNVLVNVKLNLLNYVLALFHVKFACNSTFRNPVFRWESCKGSVWENVKEKLKSMHSTGPCDWISWLAHGWQITKVDTHVKHIEELKSHANWSITWQNFQSSQAVSSWLKLATQWSCGVKSPDHSIWEKLTFRIPNTHQYKYPLCPHIVESFQREFWERNPKEK